MEASRLQSEAGLGTHPDTQKDEEEEEAHCQEHPHCQGGDVWLPKQLTSTLGPGAQRGTIHAERNVGCPTPNHSF